MSETKGDEWEQLKENIRPIQQGKRTKPSDPACIDDIVLQQQQSFENELRLYSGHDPLSVWYNYIKWIEQNFPKGGKEKHMKETLERCLSNLNTNRKYNDDDRYIDMMLNFAILSGKPLEVYNYMFANNIGSKSANFFISWSWELEQFGDWKKAYQILNKGIEYRAEPLEKMQSYFKDFEIRLMSNIQEKSKNNIIAESGRSAFSVPPKRNSIPVLKTDELVNRDKISLNLNRQQMPLKSVCAPVKAPFKVHNSENIKPLPVLSQVSTPSDSISEPCKENEPGTNNKVSLKIKPQDMKITNPTFKAHCDGENRLESHVPQSITKMSKIPVSKSKIASPKIALFEPFDPLKKPMYPKSKVYCGSKELSLEEIRAAEWLDLRKKREQDLLFKEQQKMISEQQKREEELKQKVDKLVKQVEFLKNHILKSAPKEIKLSDSSQGINTLESSITGFCELDKVSRLEKINIERNDIDTTSDSQNNLPSYNYTYSEQDCNQIFSLQNKSVISNASSIIENKCSDSNNFCDTDKMLPKFCNSYSLNFGKSKTANDEQDQECHTSVLNNMSNTNTGCLKKEKQSSVLREPTNDLPFAFYHDPTATIVNPNVEIPYVTVQSKENVNLFSNEISADEDTENVPPKDYTQDTTKRELVGILQPSKNIFFIPLEEQEQLDNSDDEDEEENYVYHPGAQYSDDTLIPPSNTEQFKTDQFISSTPYIPRNRSSILEKSEEHVTPSKSDDNTMNQQHLAEGFTLPQKHENDQEIVKRYDFKSIREHSDMPRLSKVLSIIMETTTEAYSKSSSSSCASLTRSNNLDQHSNQRLNTLRQCSKSETYEPSALSCVSEISNGTFNTNSQSASKISLRLLKERNQKFQLHTVDNDPFDSEINLGFLNSVDFKSYKNLYYIDKSIKSFKGGENICIGNESYRISSLVAEGAYAKVFEADKCDRMNVNGKSFALKVCKNSNEWEFYICNELQKRLTEQVLFPDIRNSVMKVISAVKYSKGIILVTDFSKFGTLLDAINFFKKQSSTMPESIILYFTLQILHIVSKMHECNIIHGDIKPDNFLLTNIALDSTEKMAEISSLQLIDFGRAIDLNFYDEGVCFTSVFNSNYFKCNEMKDKKPWVFQLDWYGVASCIHAMLFSDYMAVKKKDNVWQLEKRLKRYWCTSLWDSLFYKLLNIPDCYQEPDLESCISTIESKLRQDSGFNNQFERFSKMYIAQK